MDEAVAVAGGGIAFGRVRGVGQGTRAVRASGRITMVFAVNETM